MIKRLVLQLIRWYQHFLGPYTKGSCRFYPTCSEYTYQAIEKHGIIAGLAYGFCRLLRCHPGGRGGYDPVK